MLLAADRLHVEVWDLAGVPDSKGCRCWVIWGYAAQQAENRYQEIQRKREQAQSKGKRGR